MTPKMRSQCQRQPAPQHRQGLAASRSGIVVLSRSYFGRGWPEYELDGLASRMVSGEQQLLVWHNVTKREAMEYSPSFIDRITRRISMHTVETIATEIIDGIRTPLEG